MPVAVFDADSPVALAFVTSLGRRGVPLTVYGPGGFDAARWSRHCTQFRRCPALDDYERFRGWLRERLRTGEIVRVAPTSDLIAFHLAELREEFPHPVQRSVAPLIELETCLIKTRCGSLYAHRPADARDVRPGLGGRSCRAGRTHGISGGAQAQVASRGRHGGARCDRRR